MRATADRLRRVTSTIVKAGGSALEEADLVADHLVAANLAGHDSHGVGMIPTYVRHLQAGLVVPNTRAKIVKDDGPTLMFDGAPRVRPQRGRRGDGGRHRALPPDRRGGDDAGQRAPHRPRGRLRRAGQRGRPRLAALRQRDRPSRARGAVPRHRRALRHQPRLHRAARHRAPAAAAARHGDQRDRHGQGAGGQERGARGRRRAS